MEIVGRGFLAGHLADIGSRHENALALAAGVSSTAVHAQVGFGREAELVRETLTRCCSDGRTMVLFSTASTDLYGPGTDGSENQVPVPRTPYGRHKLAIEQLAYDSTADWLILRPTYLVGSGQRPHQLLPSLITQVKAGSVRVLRGARRDLLDVKDVVSAVDALLEARVTHEVVNISSGIPVPVERIVDRIEEILSARATREFIGMELQGPTVSSDKLRDLAPGLVAPGADYPWRLLDRYVPASAGPLGPRPNPAVPS
ncbi:NAD-dependent epimerase/dehydratase family protein [Streptomyces sp. AV19]|uniref:NAD-dependent epimerase/dehydratase family protein n=1 Tax=Streptomyces sp. AV19 TaxID=2793068 RepID=UPI0018FE0F50|nr:NAD-dependent epimerase/dehydratase family protein [Streptomyces sp. AV19]MBH1937774.1 NAD-dependent epimerase/dehydratase family protein [Streptomyces sp. AV19]MDG4533662.1 NAD-dependent epimerase/dehydratase family protein [Streptomyces sp. AV19]